MVMNYAIGIWPMRRLEHGRCYCYRIMWKVIVVVIVTVVTTTTITVESENVKWRDLSHSWWIMGKREYKRGIVVLSYSWIHATVTTERVRKKCIVFTCYKTNGTILIMRMDVSMSSMKRNHWITDHWWMSLTSARQLIIDVNECKGTWVHLVKCEWMWWVRATYMIWRQGTLMNSDDCQR